MKTAKSAAAWLVGLASIGVAHAQERPFCADRPGLGTPACTVDPGHAMAELGMLDWTLDRAGGTRTDMLIAGDALVRAGLTDTLEAQIGWTAFGHVRERAAGRAARIAGGTGDVRIAVRRNLSHPDGSGFSAAAMPFVSLPTGGDAIGAGDWGAGLIVPLSFALTDRIGVAVTPEIDAAVDADRHGRHLAYGSVIGLGASLSSALSGTVELQATRDDDPSGRTTQTLAGLSFALQPRGDLQFDIGAVAGLDADSPDLELYVGMARRF